MGLLLFCFVVFFFLFVHQLVVCSQKQRTKAAEAVEVVVAINDFKIFLGARQKEINSFVLTDIMGLLSQQNPKI